MDAHTETTEARGISAAAFGLGLFSALTFWWFPFGVILGAAGLVLGLLGRALAPRDWRVALGGAALSAVGLGAGLASGWGTYVRLFGL